jgi:hypothetical protein
MELFFPTRFEAGVVGLVSLLEESATSVTAMDNANCNIAQNQVFKHARKRRLIFKVEFCIEDIFVSSSVAADVCLATPHVTTSIIKPFKQLKRILKGLQVPNVLIFTSCC